MCIVQLKQVFFLTLCSSERVHDWPSTTQTLPTSHHVYIHACRQMQLAPPSYLDRYGEVTPTKSSCPQSIQTMARVRRLRTMPATHSLISPVMPSFMRLANHPPISWPVAALGTTARPARHQSRWNRYNFHSIPLLLFFKCVCVCVCVCIFCIIMLEHLSIYIYIPIYFFG